MIKFVRPVLSGYGTAIFCVAVALGLRAALDAVSVQRFPFITFLFAIMIAAWYAGQGPAIAATILSALAAAVYFLPPRGTFAIAELQDWTGLGLFIVFGFGVALFGGSMRRARQKAERIAQDALRQGEVLRDAVADLNSAIDARKQTEDILRRRERELSDFFENATIGLHWAGPDGTILRANRAELELLGFEREEYVGRPVSEFHEDQSVIADILARLSRGETIRNYEARLRRKDGSIKHVMINSNVLWENGQFIHTRCFTRDITEQKRAEANLREVARRKDEFLATLAHELRNPLAPIRNAVHIMLQLSIVDPQLQWARDVIDRQIQQMTRLIDDLLDISRISRGKVNLRKERIELAGIVKQAVETTRPLLEDRGHTLQLSVPSMQIYLEADSTRLEQILANLLNNAAKYTDPGGEIFLGVQVEGREVIIRVRDTGGGIPAEFLPHVFDMFVQSEESHDRVKGGLGIGLSLVQSLVERHGGTVSAHSEGLGKGSEFVVRLPLADTPANRITPARATQVKSGAVRRIMVVDDNVDAAASLAKLLRLKGYEVCVAHDGPDALKEIEEFSPELVFLDIGLPSMDGYEVARRIRSRSDGPRPYLVALTGWGQAEDRRLSQEAGFDCHFTKPLELQTLNNLLVDPPCAHSQAEPTAFAVSGRS